MKSINFPSSRPFTTQQNIIITIKSTSWFHKFPPNKAPSRLSPNRAAPSPSPDNAHDILGLPSQTQLSRATIRAAYLQKMKLLHPDVNRAIDTTEDAIRLNRAYQTLLNTTTAYEGGEEPRSPTAMGSWNTVGDVFDNNDGDDNDQLLLLLLLFVNPFAFYNVDPLDWEKLQEVVAGCKTEVEAADALIAAGASISSEENAIVTVNRAQMDVLVAELERMSDAMDSIAIETAEYFILNCLARKRRRRG